MATWFAERGATVHAYDVNEEPLVGARRRAAERGVEERTTFATYTGELSDLPGDFEVVFAKSTIVLMDHRTVAAGLYDRLVDGGRLLMVENAAGALPVRLARVVRRRSFRPYGATYFTPRSLDSFRHYFDVQLERWSARPPTVVVGARRPVSGGAKPASKNS